MLKTPISSVHRYSNRFLRSTDLVRDFNDPNCLQGYWLTDFGRSCLSRLGDGLKPNSSRRAWRLTGDFGSGKSSLALLFATALRDARGRLPKGLRERVLEVLPISKNSNYVPVLVVGSREPITVAILRSLAEVLAGLFPRGIKSSIETDIEKALRKSQINDKDALNLIVEANTKIIQSGKGQGTLLILDEVGKFLEFAALHPEHQDVYFLQQLAVTAERSGKQPLMVVCLLHQGFNAYAEQLAQSTQKEWEKIAGRFEEILFQQPLDQIAQLVSSALNLIQKGIPETLEREAEFLLKQAIMLGWYGTSASRETLFRLKNRLFPLDPMLLPVLVRTFQRFGQNERSLFSFLSSHEPFGLRAFSNSIELAGARLYRLADFYDYVRTNFGHRLSVVSYRTHWSAIESSIELRNDPRELTVLKTIGVLNLLSVDDLRPTEEAVCWAVGGNSKSERSKVGETLKKLAANKVLHYRGEVRGYSLWPYTSVDIDSRMDEARRAIPTVSRISQAIDEQLDSRPIVARAHYIKTGNLRYFDVVYCKVAELLEKAKASELVADGLILVPLCETEAEHKEAKALAGRIENDGLIRAVAIPRPLNHLNQVALDALRWEWIQRNTPELNNDPFAREEVQLHLQESRNRLQAQVQSFIGLNRISGESTLTWFYFDKEGELQSSSHEFKSGRKILSWLSMRCDEAFPKAPQIKNELVNRHNLSSAAAGARMRLLELMFAHADKKNLGLPDDRKPPERSMYLSVLKATGLHQTDGNAWKIGIPESKADISSVRYTLRKIHDLIMKKPDTRVSIGEIMNTLRRPPFGVRDGLFPIFLAVLAIANEQEIAFFENGTFLREVGKDAFLRMTKSPEKFEIQYCKIEGIRSILFQRLTQILELSPKALGKEVELLDVVRNLCQFVAQLPEYVRNTKRLSPSALAVRTVILDAREPVKMVFHNLPEACGYPKFEIGKAVTTKQVHDFVTELSQAINELRGTYHSLMHRVERGLAKEFGYGNQPASQYRRKLAGRAEPMLVRVTESKLKAFAFRLFDENLPEPDWFNSVGSVLALRPLEKWKDEDEDTFFRELESAGGRFRRAESVAFKTSPNAKGGEGLRIAITQADGMERQEVIHFSADEEGQLNCLQDQIATLIKKNERLGLAAASRAIWSQLKDSEGSQ
jgi:hypothetical protein